MGKSILIILAFILAYFIFAFTLTDIILPAFVELCKILFYPAVIIGAIAVINYIYKDVTSNSPKKEEPKQEYTISDEIFKSKDDLSFFEEMEEKKESKKETFDDELVYNYEDSSVEEVEEKFN